METYKLENYEGYSITVDGKVWSDKTELFLATSICNGYEMVHLSNNKKGTVHRLVAQTFIPNPENKPYVSHINSDKLDNRVENLD
jgi:HNH endonuclease